MGKSRKSGLTSARYADKKGYPKGTKPGEENIQEYIPYNMPADTRIADRYGEDEREDNERINKNDPQKFKSKQQLAEELIGDLSQNFNIGKKTKEKKEAATKKIQETIKTPFKCMKGLEYACKVVRIDDFGNATIALKNGKIQGIIYNARKIGLAVGMKREVLFARTNKKGRFVFELPKNPDKIVKEYYDTYAKGMSQEETVKKLFTQYGSKNVKETLKSIIDEEILEKTWNEFKKAA